MRPRYLTADGELEICRTEMLLVLLFQAVDNLSKYQVNLKVIGFSTEDVKEFFDFLKRNLDMRIYFGKNITSDIKEMKNILRIFGLHIDGKVYLNNATEEKSWRDLKGLINYYKQSYEEVYKDLLDKAEFFLYLKHMEEKAKDEYMKRKRYLLGYTN